MSNAISSLGKKVGPLSVIFISLLIGFSLTFFQGCRHGKGKDKKLSPTLTIFNWEEYIDMDVVKEFEKKYGVDVIIEYFENEDEMMSLVQSSPEKYDLTIASDSVVVTMTRLGLLARLNTENIPNISKVDTTIAKSPNPMGMKYSIPYVWGTSGIAVNRRYVKDEDIGWEILFDKRFAGRIDMLDDIQENFAAALKVLGVSINTTDLETLQKAEDLLWEQKKIIRGYFNSYDIQRHLEEGSTHVAYHYSCDSLMAMEKNEDIEYLVPDSGAPIWMDNWIIPATAKNKYTAEVFINFILEPENIGRISNFIWSANAVPKSRKYLDEELLESKELYLPKSLLEKCEFYRPLDHETNKFLNRVWFQLKK